MGCGPSADAADSAVEEVSNEFQVTCNHDTSTDRKEPCEITVTPDTTIAEAKVLSE